MRLLEPPQALSALHPPDLDLAVLTTTRQHLAVATERHRQYRLLHHHKVVLRLVLQVLPDFTGREIPHLDEAVDRASDQVLAVGRETSTFHVRLLTKFDLLRQLRRIFLVLLIANCRLTSEQIYRGPWRQQTLMLLPLQRLPQQGKQSTGRYYGYFTSKSSRYVCPSFLFCASIRVCLSWIKIRARKQIFCKV